MHPPVDGHESACYPRWRSECTDWHPRKWTRASQGNGARGGTGRPSTKGSKKSGNTSSNNKSKDKSKAKKSSFSVVKKLESELTKTRAELSSQRVVGKTFRDALLASQVPPPQHHLHATNTKARPATTASVPVLPTELVTLLSTLARALAAAGIPSQ